MRTTATRSGCGGVIEQADPRRPNPHGRPYLAPERRRITADRPMKLVIHPSVEPERLDRVAAAAGTMAVVNAADEGHALRHLPDAAAFFGKITPHLLAAAP